MAENNVRTFVLFQKVWFLKKYGKYIRHDMLDFPLLWAVTFACYCSSMQDK